MRQPWSGLLLAYLVASLPLLLAGVVGRGGGWSFLAVHGAVLAWVASMRRRVPSTRAGAAAEDWAVPLLLPFLYAELPLLMAGLPGPVEYHDPAVRALERALFGGEPAWQWAPALPVPWLSELLHLGYLLYYPVIYLPPLLLWTGVTGPREPGRRAEAFRRTVTALAVAVVVCFAVMVAWPVQGPRYLGVPEAVPPGPFRSAVLAVLEAGSSRGAAFPSSHVAVAVAQSVLALRWQPGAGAAVAVVTLLLSAGAVYGGFHYLVDVLAGAVVGGLAAAVALKHPLSGRSRNPA